MKVISTHRSETGYSTRVYMRDESTGEDRIIDLTTEEYHALENWFDQ